MVGMCLILVGMARFELTTPASRRQCSTRLSYTPTHVNSINIATRIAESSLRDEVLYQNWASPLSYTPTHVNSINIATRIAGSSLGDEVLYQNWASPLSYTPTR